MRTAKEVRKGKVKEDLTVANRDVSTLGGNIRSCLSMDLSNPKLLDLFQSNANISEDMLGVASGDNFVPHPQLMTAVNNYELTGVSNDQYQKVVGATTYRTVNSFEYDYFASTIMPLYNSALRANTSYNASFVTAEFRKYINASFGLLRFFYTTVGLLSLMKQATSNPSLQTWYSEVNSGELMNELNKVALVLQTLPVPPAIQNLAYVASMPFVMYFSERRGTRHSIRFFTPNGLENALRSATPAAEWVAALRAQVSNVSDQAQADEASKLARVFPDWLCVLREPQLFTSGPEYDFLVKQWINHGTVAVEMTTAVWVTTVTDVAHYSPNGIWNALDGAMSNRAIYRDTTSVPNTEFVMPLGLTLNHWLASPYEENFAGANVYFAVQGGTNIWKLPNDGYEGVEFHMSKPYAGWTYTNVANCSLHFIDAEDTAPGNINVMNALFEVDTVRAAISLRNTGGIRHTLVPYGS